MNVTLLTLSLLILSIPIPVGAAETRGLDSYLAAIDAPLTTTGITMMGGTSETLLEKVLDEQRTLYQRGRSLAAFAMVSDHTGVDTLTLLADTHMHPALRKQALISLAKVYGASAPARVTATLIERLPGPPRWAETIQSLLDDLRANHR